MNDKELAESIRKLNETVSKVKDLFNDLNKRLKEKLND